MERPYGLRSRAVDERRTRRELAVNRGAAPLERVAAIRDLVQDVEPDVQARASLWHEVLYGILFDEAEDDGVREAVALSASDLGLVVVNNLGRSTSPEKPQIRRAVVATLGEIGRRPLPPHSEERLREDLAALDGVVTEFPFVNMTLQYGGDQRVVPVLLRGVNDPSATIRSSAVIQLACIGQLEPAALALAGDADPVVRSSAADAIGHYWTGEPEPIEALRDAVHDGDPAVVKAAKSALRRLRRLELPTPQRSGRSMVWPEVDPRFAWSSVLRQWSRELCADEGFILTQDDAVIESGWTGTEPVNERELQDLELRLGRHLPPSYRSFLQTTDGYVGGGTVPRSLPARDVDLFVRQEPDWVATWIESAELSPTVAEHVATRGQDVLNARWELLTGAIQVSEVYDGAVYLLCPNITDDEGEWESWIFATWLPGAERFASWWDLFDHECQGWKRRGA